MYLKKGKTFAEYELLPESYHGKVSITLVFKILGIKQQMTNTATLRLTLTTNTARPMDPKKLDCQITHKQSGPLNLSF